MSPQGVITVLILVAATVAFAVGRWRPDAIAVLVLLALLLLRVVDVPTGLAGFGSPALLTIGAVFVLSAAFEKVGLAAAIGQRIFRLAGASETRLILAFGTTAGLLSGVMNSLGAVAVLLPAAMAAAREARISPSKLLLPMALGTRLGGVLTLIAGPSNLIASEALAVTGRRPFSLFELVPLGAVFLIAGVLYMAFLGRRWLPDRAPLQPPLSDPLADLYRLQERLFQVRVEESSPLVGKTIAQSELGKTFGVTVVSITRGSRRIMGPSRDETLMKGDALVVQGRREEVLHAHTLEAMGLSLADHPAPFQVESADVRIVEVILAPRSTLAGKTLREIGFREKYGLTVLAIWREGQPRRTGLVDLPIQHGDALLIQGPEQRTRILRREPDFLVLELDEGEGLRATKAPWAVAAFAVMVIASTLSLLPLALATLLAAAVVVAAGCLTVEEVYQAIDWRSLVFIGALFPLGSALATTGAAETAVSVALGVVGRMPLLVLLTLLLLATILNQLMPSVAATVVLAPVALHLATTTGVNVHAFMMAVVAGTGTTFTPIGSPVNLLVMGPGGYQLRDYVRIGLPLAVLLSVLGSLIIPLRWPLSP